MEFPGQTFTRRETQQVYEFLVETATAIDLGDEGNQPERRQQHEAVDAGRDGVPRRLGWPQATEYSQGIDSI